MLSTKSHISRLIQVIFSLKTNKTTQKLTTLIQQVFCGVGLDHGELINKVCGRFILFALRRQSQSGQFLGLIAHIVKETTIDKLGMLFVFDWESFGLSVGVHVVDSLGRGMKPTFRLHVLI